LERQLEEIFEFEETQWQRRGGVKWILKGDSNNGYFHGVASGRNKKCTIFSLETENGTIHEQQVIREHVESYYKELFGKEPRGAISLGADFWLHKGRLADEEAQNLIKSFTLKDMDPNVSPGPDGLSVSFYREFWAEIKAIMLEMFQELFRGELNLRRLNYDMISLIPNLEEATTLNNTDLYVC
jgi:hypothetical protein